MLILHPWWERHVQEKERVSILNQWDELHLHQNEFVQLSETLQVGPSAVEAEMTNHSPVEQEKVTYIDGYAVLGKLSIDKLDLKEPVIESADPEALRMGIGVVESDRRPGLPGNFVLAGHRSWTYGKQFSRLNELESGDNIVVDTPGSSSVYTVTSKFLVDPEDLSVLDQNKDKAELTLITCEPMYNPTHRLIVKAALKG